MTTFKYTVGQLVLVKSGRTYRITSLRGDNHRVLKGEVGYDLVQIKNGKPYGASQLIRESNLRPAEA